MNNNRLTTQQDVELPEIKDCTTFAQLLQHVNKVFSDLREIKNNHSFGEVVQCKQRCVISKTKGGAMRRYDQLTSTEEIICRDKDDKRLEGARQLIVSQYNELLTKCRKIYCNALRIDREIANLDTSKDSLAKMQNVTCLVLKLLPNERDIVNEQKKNIDDSLHKVLANLDEGIRRMANLQTTSTTVVDASEVTNVDPELLGACGGHTK